MWILDAHLDLSMNAMEWNRDLTRSVAEIRDREQGQTVNRIADKVPWRCRICGVGDWYLCSHPNRPLRQAEQ